MMRDAIDEDSGEGNKLFDALIDALSLDLNKEINKWILTTFKSIFEIAEKHKPSNFTGDFFEKVFEKFIDAGGPETLESLLNDENTGIQQLAYELSTKYCLEENDEFFSVPPSYPGEEEMKF